MVALDYLKKHGHFRFVNRGEKQKQGQRTSYDTPPDQETTTEEPAPKAEAPEEEMERQQRVAASYKPSHASWIVTTLLLLVVGVFYMIASSLSDSPKDRVEAYLNQPKVERRPPLLTIVDSLKDEYAEEEEEDEEKWTFLDTFFTLGSNKEWVSFVQGPPLKISGPHWRYGHSTVFFSGDSVIGWISSELSPLYIDMLLDSSWNDTLEYFSIGARKIDVAALHGAPDLLDGNNWSYGEAQVRFKADTVVSWKNDIKNTLLAVEIEPPEETEESEDKEELDANE